MQPGPIPTALVGTGPGFVTYFAQKERVMAAPVPFLFYLGKDLGVETCCHPSPLSV
jgi:hypothetical protein